MGRPDTDLSVQILASLRQSCSLVHQRGGLLKVDEQNTLYSVCTFETPHLMEL